MQMLKVGASAREAIVLVSGGSGFIGRQCLRPLVESGCTVHAVSRRPPSVADDRLTWHTADLLRVGQARQLVAAVRPTHLLHLAWYAEPGAYWTAIDNYHHVRAGLELLEAFADSGGQRAVIAGTVAEYDWRYGYCREELTPLAPTTAYGVCKHALQLMASTLARDAGLGFAWGRVFWLYGPHEHPARLVASVICALLRGQAALCSSGEQRRPFLHVADVARAFVALLFSDVTGAINIASADPVPVREVVETVARQLGARELLRIGALRQAANEPPLLAADTRRLTQEVGWSPVFDLESGIADTIAWWRTQLSTA
jgi:nucleoside-diphosphate-sugar epimerase